MKPVHQTTKQGFSFLLGINFATFYHHPTYERLIIIVMNMILVGITNALLP